MKMLLCRLFLPSALVILLAASSSAAERCDSWVARAVSVQGIVEARLGGEDEWVPVEPESTFCPGDMIRLREKSRAALVLANETVVRLDQNTAITFSGIEDRDVSLLDLVKGVIHFISRVPRTLKVVTPYVNASVEGTEFLVSVDEGRASVTVFEGRVLASNSAGSVLLTDGQSAVAGRGEPPVITILVNPRDTVQWALHYPPVIEYGEEATVDENDPDYLAYRASSLLSVGSVEEARGLIERALRLAPGNGPALALLSVIAVAQNDRDEALRLARRAVDADPASVPARIALSYALQANFDLEGALECLLEALVLAPENGLAWARLAEMHLSFGHLDEALEAAEKAVRFNPRLSRTQTVLGFAHLMQLDVEGAERAFEKAIELDQADPLARLGLGLAKIRRGDLSGGRREMEIAASLDPGRSIIRSYLGKAYYEEKREDLAADQYAMAGELDPGDPTPFFYDAILKQSMNRPVEALHDMQKAIALNDNRAVYRSRLLLDDDLAARSAGIARIYRDLGFRNLALVEGWKSVNTDPGNYSAHRLLADSYASQPRHEIARVSELLQSQLLQPLSITPLQPRLAETDLFIYDGTGPGDLSFNEFNPLFNRNRLALQLSGVFGGNDTFGDEIVAAGVRDKLSLSVGQFHYGMDGFRENNDLREDIYNVFIQYSPGRKSSIQAEYRYKEIEKGDLSLNFDPDAYFPTLREESLSRLFRVGLHRNISPRSDLIASVIYQGLDLDYAVPPVFAISSVEKGCLAEVQHQYNGGRFYLISGLGHFFSDVDYEMSEPAVLDADVRHSNAYAYSRVNFPDPFFWTIGVSADFFDNGPVDKEQLNPKLGLTWTLSPATTLRAAVFRTLKRQLVSNQTIEPTQVAGFNQFFDDGNGTDAWRYGVAVDQAFSEGLFGGVEFSHRDLDVPFLKYTIPSAPVSSALLFERAVADWEEDLYRAYLYWAPLSWMAVSGEYQYEEFNRRDFFAEDIKNLETSRFPVGLSLFSPGGIIVSVKTTYVDQSGEFFDPMASAAFEGSDNFWVVDASMGLRLPGRHGLLSVEAKNLFDEEFRFQDTDPANPSIYPERLLLCRFTLTF